MTFLLFAMIFAVSILFGLIGFIITKKYPQISTILFIMAVLCLIIAFSNCGIVTRPSVLNGYNNHKNNSVGAEINLGSMPVNAALSYQYWLKDPAKNEVSGYIGLGGWHFFQIQYGLSNLSYKKLRLNSALSIGFIRGAEMGAHDFDFTYPHWWDNIAIGGFYEARFDKPIIHSYGLSIGYVVGFK